MFLLGASAFPAFVGIFFGIYPAIRASALDTVQALRPDGLGAFDPAGRTGCGAARGGLQCAALAGALILNALILN